MLLIDDCKQWRLAVRSISESAGIRVVGEASDGLEGIEKAAQLRPDIVLLDIGMPRLNGIEAARKIMQVCPESKTIFLTQEHDRELQVEALATGATAYVLKSTVASELQPAIERTMLHRKPPPHRRGHLSLEPATLFPGL